MSMYGVCDLRKPHEDHMVDGWADWSCPGQYADCRNCDDRKCMGCIFREYGHACADDCPECC